MLVLVVDEKLDLEHDEKQVECLMIVGLWAFPSLSTKMPVPEYHVPTPPSINSGEDISTESLQEGC
ncbi:unnamed protein product [Prunus armeniaca]